MYQHTTFIDNCRVRFKNDTNELIIQFENSHEGYLYSFKEFKQPTMVTFTSENVVLLYEYMDTVKLLFFNFVDSIKPKTFNICNLHLNKKNIETYSSFGTCTVKVYSTDLVNSLSNTKEIFLNSRLRSILNKTYYINNQGKVLVFQYFPNFSCQELTIPIDIQYIESGCEFVVLIGEFNNMIYLYTHGSGYHGCLGKEKAKANEVVEAFKVPKEKFDRVECVDFGVKVFLKSINSIFIWGWNKDFELSSCLDDNVVLYEPAEIEIDD
ncbi:Regulator of chromosome condensation 1/beta-lactamase-inhibitor protein II domain-containing protein [Strongyloides ratti]|uniref:Regulator of chromosome condensation 1/beta-lactamase-inhibitor protein II domain-containing protein n=1 Tax=Strongyloides ratti TaxID=34506 RepID=A0A090LJW0_STRRB|nr:Regulator of chromosome condensation 1/beta-lactamase-inhibitor protein II domain-containing protein [Strongyloides ratti]CEF67815.1 Regulator of chromosome condensation 1/beta-lactamase-inhibitor protein II domain-containing protein [Strongyloides ratti]